MRGKYQSKLFFLFIMALLALLLFQGTVHAASYRIGIPRGHQSPTFKKVINGLAKKNIFIDNNLTIVQINIENIKTEEDKIKIRSEIASKCDLFFTFGSHFGLVKQLQVQTPVFFIATANTKSLIPKDMQDNTTGFYWESTATLFNRSLQILPPEMRNSLGLIYYKGSKLETQVPKYKKAGQEAGTNLVVKSYVGLENIYTTMKEFKDEGVQSVILFPPAFKKNELSALIAQQNLLKLPLIGQVREHVEMGILGGPTIDYDHFIPEVVSYIEKMLNGRSPEQLPIKYFSRKYVLNLATASRLGIEVPSTTVSQSTVVGKSAKSIHASKPVPIIAGSYTIGFPENLPKVTQKDFLEAFSHLGYIENNNLSTKHFDVLNNDTASGHKKIIQWINTEVDLFITHGNVLPILGKLSEVKIPILYVSTKETADKIPASLKNVTGIVRASFNSIFSKARQIVPGSKNMGMIVNKKQARTKHLETYQKTANSIGIGLDFRMFDDRKEIENIMKSLQQSCDYILLFPPFVKGKDLEEIISWQNTLKFPVLGQLKAHIQKGLLGGPIVDNDKIMPKLAEFADKLLKGRKPKHLPVYYFAEKIVLNLSTVRKLELIIPTKITTQAEITH